MVHPLRHPTSTRNILHVVVVRWTTTRRALSTLSCDTNDVDGDGGGDTSMLQRSYGPRHRHMCMWTVLLLNWSRMGEDVPIAVLLEYNEHGMEEAVVDHHVMCYGYNCICVVVVGWNIQQSTTKITTYKQTNYWYIMWRCAEQLSCCFEESGWNISEEYESTMKRWQRYPMKRGVVLSVDVW